MPHRPQSSGRPANMQAQRTGHEQPGFLGVPQLPSARAYKSSVPCGGVQPDEYAGVLPAERRQPGTHHRQCELREAQLIFCDGPATSVRIEVVVLTSNDANRGQAARGPVLKVTGPDCPDEVSRGTLPLSETTWTSWASLVATDVGVDCDAAARVGLDPEAE